jgi:hypothetical protein
MPKMCNRCGLADPNEDVIHKVADDCINHMRMAMQNQRLAAERLGMDISIHFLRVLEELALDPDAGIQYAIWNQEENKQEVVHASRVSGVFASILKRYREMCDFSPHAEEVKKTSFWAKQAGLLAGILESWKDKYEIEEGDRNHVDEIVASIEAKQPPPGPRDPSGS